MSSCSEIERAMDNFVIKLLITLFCLGESIASNGSECQLDDLHALGWWMDHRNQTHLSPIEPVTDDQLRSIALEDLHKQPQLTARVNCTNDASESAPLLSRALCPFHYRLNYDPKRLPSSIVEADCHCSEESVHIKCTPLSYQIRVLKFDNNCSTFKQSFESIQLACIPTIQAIATAHKGPSDEVIETFHSEH